MYTLQTCLHIICYIITVTYSYSTPDRQVSINMLILMNYSVGLAVAVSNVCLKLSFERHHLFILLYSATLAGILSALRVLSRVFIIILFYSLY